MPLAQTPRIVVLGGSSGIGLAVAGAAVEAGWDVTIASRNAARIDLPAEKIVLDVRDSDSVRRTFSTLGPIDHLVSTTVERAAGLLKELDLDAARRAFDVKLWGPLAAVQAAQVRESIVLVSGGAATVPIRGSGATAAVNGAVEALVRTLAVELAPVRVNAVSPGTIDTPTWQSMPQAARERIFSHAACIPAGRVGRPEEVADAILLLLRNGFVTGSVLPVDGGGRLAGP